MSAFENYKSFKKLQKLAGHPFDLTGDKAEVKRISEYVAQNCGYQLFYGLERVDNEVMGALFELAGEAKALEKMNAMQAGETINFIKGYESENRKVLHTALRDIFNEKRKEKSAAEASSLANREVEKLKKFIGQIDKENKFTDLIQIGIGGSILGPHAMSEALEVHKKKGRRVHFVSNVDPDDLVRTVKNVDLSKTLVVSVSKSGTTLETVTNEAFIKNELVKKGLDPKKHIIAVTAKGSPMDNQDYLEVFYIWDFVGGRFSPTSMVGGVALSFLSGMDVYLKLLQGAHDMDKVALEKENNLPLLAALLGIWNRNFLNHSSIALVPYSSSLFYFCYQIQQYDMESNGKSVDREGRRVNFATGPLVLSSIGTDAQHSFFQSLHQGTDITPIEFIGFKKSQSEEDILIKNTTSQQKLLSNLFGQALALARGRKNTNPNKNFEGNRPSLILLGEKLTPYSLGALISFYEHKVAFQGFIWDINSFDQEGVELGKILSLQMMNLFSHKKEDFPWGEAFFKECDFN